MATQEQINAISEVILKIFKNDLKTFEESLEAIRINTAKVTLENKMAAIDAEIKVFTEQKEAEKQALLGLK